jgi:hypothetical protein
LVHIFIYISDHFSPKTGVSEVQFPESLPYSHTTLISEYLWTSAKSFSYPVVFSPGPAIKYTGQHIPILSTGEPFFYTLCNVSLDEDNKSYSQTATCLKKFSDTIFKNHSRADHYMKYLGHFFTFPDCNFYYFISHCTEDHEHSRILFLDRISLVLKAYLDVSGDVRAIWLSPEKEIFIVKQQNCARKFDRNSRLSRISDFNRPLEYLCSLENPWINKYLNKKTKSVFLLIEKINFDGSNYHIFSQSKNTLQNVSDEINYNNIEAATNMIANIGNFDTCLFTKDFLCITSQGETLLMGRNHEMHILINWAKRCKTAAFFHPSLPIVFTRSNAQESFKLYLLKNATWQERIQFPFNPDRSYKKRTSYELNSA